MLHVASGQAQIGGALLWKVYAEVAIPSSCVQCDCTFTDGPSVTVQPSVIQSLFGGGVESSCTVLYSEVLPSVSCRMPGGCPGGATAESVRVVLECVSGKGEVSYHSVVLSACPAS